MHRTKQISYAPSRSVSTSTAAISSSAMCTGAFARLRALLTWSNCQGRRATRPKGGVKHCHRGLRGEMVRGGRDEVGGGVSRKLRSGYALPSFPAAGDAQTRSYRPLFSRTAVVEAEALAVHFQDMDVRDKSLDQCPGHRTRYPGTLLDFMQQDSTRVGGDLAAVAPPPRVTLTRELPT